jgi:hypothetical protein
MNQVLLLHDNARPHTSLLRREPIATTILLPFFGPLKNALRGCRFVDDDELKHSVYEKLQGFSKEFYATGIQHLM